MCNTPILFIIFNRPDVTSKVFEEIRKQKPKTLYIAADGPRKNCDSDYLNCKKTRQIVLDSIDWNCDVKTLFRDSNLGCGKAVSGAIDWFFANVEMGIILEDDCLPNRSFFSFCENLLNCYKENEQIFAISGVNFQNNPIGNASYFFSKYLYVWGWASWRRAWEKYDYDLADLDSFKRRNEIDCIDRRKNFKKYWYTIFDKVAAGEIDTWDYQLVFSSWINNGLTVVPNVNLVSNIGFGKEATHTTTIGPLANLKTEEILKIKHPEEITRSKKADRYVSREVYNIQEQRTIFKYLVNIVRKIFRYGL